MNIESQGLIYIFFPGLDLPFNQQHCYLYRRVHQRTKLWYGAWCMMALHRLPMLSLFLSPGFAYSTEQLCAYCDPARELVNPCCALQTTDISLCGYTLSTNQILSTSTPSSSTSAIATSSTQSSSSVVVPTSAALSRSRQLSGGTIAGVVIGSVIGALLLVLLLLLWRRRRNRSTDHAGAYESAAGSTPSPSTAYVSEKVDLQQCVIPMIKQDVKLTLLPMVPQMGSSQFSRSGNCDHHW